MNLVNIDALFQLFLQQYVHLPIEKRQKILKQLLQTISTSDLSFVHNYLQLSKRLCVDFVADLPPEISVQILVNLPGESCVRAARVSRKWYALIHDNQLWHRICKQKGWIDNRFQSKWKADSMVLCQKRSFYSSPNSSLLMGNDWKRVFVDRYLTKMNWNQGKYVARTIEKRSRLNNDMELTVSFDDNLQHAVSSVGQLWNISSGNVCFNLHGHTGQISSVKISNNYIVTGGVDRTLRQWCRRDGKFIRVFNGHAGEIECLAFDGKMIVSGSQDCTLRVWDIDSGICLAVLTGHDEAVTCVQMDEREIISGSSDNCIRIWNKQSSFACSRILRGHESTVYCLSMDKGSLISGSGDCKIKIWKRETGELIRTLEGHRDAVVCLQFDGEKIVSGSSDQSIKVWSYATGAILYSLRKHSAPVWNLRFDDCRLMSTGFDQTVIEWNFSGLKLLSHQERQKWSLNEVE